MIKDTYQWSRYSLVLLVGGLTYIAVGLSKMFNGISDAREEALVFALDILSIETWGAVFMLVGFAAAITAVWMPSYRVWGYLLLTGFSTAWGLFHIEGILLADANTEALSSSLLWCLTAFMWWALGSMVPVELPIDDS